MDHTAWTIPHSSGKNRRLSVYWLTFLADTMEKSSSARREPPPPKKKTHTYIKGGPLTPSEFCNGICVEKTGMLELLYGRFTVLVRCTRMAIVGVKGLKLPMMTNS